MQNLQTPQGHFKADGDALLTLEGLVVSSPRLGDEEKANLIAFLYTLCGISRSRQAIERSVRALRTEGVW